MRRPARPRLPWLFAMIAVALIRVDPAHPGTAPPGAGSSIDPARAADTAWAAVDRLVADYIGSIRVRTLDEFFMDEGEERPGKLGLYLAEGKDGWRIVAVLFAYDAE